MASNRHFARIVLMQSLYEYLQRGGDILEITRRNAERYTFEENNAECTDRSRDSEDNSTNRAD